MRLALSLPVLVLVLSMVLEGPAPAQAAPDILEMLKEFGNTLENKAREAIEHIKQKDIATKTGLDPFPGHRRAGVCRGGAPEDGPRLTD
uniref:Apolipoprotein C1 n=1 Tax=Microcebus murinus TaxID=30608 RepID=A0A8C6EK13_MICMU